MKKRNLFMSSTIMCGFLCFAFNFDDNGMHWLWAGNKPVVVILAITTAIFAILWIKYAKLKFKK